MQRQLWGFSLSESMLTQEVNSRGVINRRVQALTVRPVSLRMDLDLLQGQPSVLVHAEVVQNFGRRFSVRVFHFGGRGLDDQTVRHVVELHRWRRLGSETAVISTDGRRRLLSVARSPVPPEETNLRIYGTDAAVALLVGCLRYFISM